LKIYKEGEKMDYLNAFWVGGLICVIGQILIDKTKITPARILVLFVVIGCILGGFDIYDKIIDYAGAGASVPLPGFGNLLANGVKEEIDAEGAIGILTGGLKAASAGITAAVIFSLLGALAFNPKEK
jgi:stage V sporulation protein AE